jgi:hypothetical protein
MLLAVAGLLPAMLGALPPMAAAASPSEDGVFVFATGTVAFSPSNAWTVGFGGIENTGFLHSLILHWNGQKWVNVNILQGVSLDGLDGVSATGPSDIWGV